MQTHLNFVKQLIQQYSFLQQYENCKLRASQLDRLPHRNFNVTVVLTNHLLGFDQIGIKQCQVQDGYEAISGFKGNKQSFHQAVNLKILLIASLSLNCPLRATFYLKQLMLFISVINASSFKGIWWEYQSWSCLSALAVSWFWGLATRCGSSSWQASPSSSLYSPKSELTSLVKWQSLSLFLKGSERKPAIKPVTMAVPAAIPMKASWQQIRASSMIWPPSPESMVPKLLQILYMAGERTRPPRIELMRMGPMMPRWSNDRVRFILGCTTRSQNPLSSPEKAPIAMQAPMLLIVPATTAIVTPPLSTPTNDSRTPTFSLPKSALLMQVQMTLAVSAKQMLRGPLLLRKLLEVVGQRMPVNGKQAKMKPVPMSAMKAECREPVEEGFPGLRLRMAEVTSAKKPAKTQTQFVPQSSQS